MIQVRRMGFLIGTLLVLGGVVVGLIFALLFVDNPEETPEQSDPPEAFSTVVVAGDISCDEGAVATDFACRDKDTAGLITTLNPDAVLTTGDNQYQKGTYQAFQNVYDKTWGAFKGVTYPTPGNHEYETPGASGYFDYFGTRAGDRDKGYYTFTVGAWRLYALNSEIDISASSAQIAWLKDELNKNGEQCSLAYWHKPRFSTGLHGSDPNLDAAWRALYEKNVDIIVNGHSHNYERFVPLNPDGLQDATRGITQFVSGMGGYGPEDFSQLLPTLATRQNYSFGVVQLNLYADRAVYEFMPTSGAQDFFDRGTINCH